jgi:hypothetical protein
MSASAGPGAATSITSFAQLQSFINQVLTANNEWAGVSDSPHLAFWTTLSYQQFVTSNVPGVTDPNTGSPMPILVKGSSATSNLILALQGVGPDFGPDGGIGQMPSNGPPFFTTDQIASIAAWIDNGCPE